MYSSTVCVQYLRAPSFRISCSVAISILSANSACSIFLIAGRIHAVISLAVEKVFDYYEKKIRYGGAHAPLLYDSTITF